MFTFVIHIIIIPSSAVGLSVSMLIVPGTAGAVLAARLSSITGFSLVTPHVTRFADGEIGVEVPSNPRDQNKHVVIVQSLCCPANDHLMELLLVVDAVKRALLPKRVTALIPYLCYTRQDRPVSRKTSSDFMISALSAKVVAKLLGTSGVSQVITVDLHSSQSAGFFDMTLTSLPSHSVFIDDIVENGTLDKLAVVAPDGGSTERVREFLRALSERSGVSSIQVATIEKYRESPGVSEVVHVMGNVRDRYCIILDDIVDSGGTLCNAAAALKARGAVGVSGYITHGVLSGKALSTVQASELDTLVVSDTIQHSQLDPAEKIRVRSVSRPLGDYILSFLTDGGPLGK